MYTPCNMRSTGERSVSSKLTRFGGRSENAPTNVRSAKPRSIIGVRWVRARTQDLPITRM